MADLGGEERIREEEEWKDWQELENFRESIAGDKLCIICVAYPCLCTARRAEERLQEIRKSRSQEEEDTEKKNESAPLKRKRSVSIDIEKGFYKGKKETRPEEDGRKTGPEMEESGPKEEDQEGILEAGIDYDSIRRSWKDESVGQQPHQAHHMKVVDAVVVRNMKGIIENVHVNTNQPLGTSKPGIDEGLCKLIEGLKPVKKKETLKPADENVQVNNDQPLGSSKPGMDEGLYKIVDGLKPVKKKDIMKPVDAKPGLKPKLKPATVNLGNAHENLNSNQPVGISEPGIDEGLCTIVKGLRPVKSKDVKKPFDTKPGIKPKLKPAIRNLETQKTNPILKLINKFSQPPPSQQTQTHNPNPPNPPASKPPPKTPQETKHTQQVAQSKPTTIKPTKPETKTQPNKPVANKPHGAYEFFCISI